MTDNINPAHYKSGKVECIDALEAATSQLSGIEAVCTANAIKYLWRWKQKNGAEDLRKAKWYLDRLIAEQSQSGPAKPSCGWPDMQPGVQRYGMEPEWVEWGGGECPVNPGASVEVRLRMGLESESIACAFDWGHNATYSSDADIVAYRVKEQS